MGRADSKFPLFREETGVFKESVCVATFVLDPHLLWSLCAMYRQVSFQHLLKRKVRES
jgi:hypothetical protein